MISKSILPNVLALITLTAFLGCNGIIKNRVKFNKPQWESVGDFNSRPDRESMFEDLIEYHQIKGLTYRQLIDLLGIPDNYGDQKDSVRYDIVVNYGYLDPKSGKYLAIGFNKDSIITGFKIVDWKNRHADE